MPWATLIEEMATRVKIPISRGIEYKWIETINKKRRKHSLMRDYSVLFWNLMLSGVEMARQRASSGLVYALLVGLLLSVARFGRIWATVGSSNPLQSTRAILSLS